MVSSFRSFFSAVSISVLSALVVASTPTAAQDAQRIAATVNNAVISAYDVEQRANLFFFSTGVERTPQSIQRARQRVIRELIDEQLQLQEAAKYEVAVTREEVDQTLGSIASRNNMTGVQLAEFLRASGVNPVTMMVQVEADLAWNRVVQGLLSSRVSISEEEIDFVIDRMRRSINQPEYEVSEIFLSVDNPDQEERIRQGAESLVAQIRQGANFAGIARQFSQNPSAANGGDLGWVLDGQLPDEVNETLRRLAPGQFSLPVRSTGGYYLLALRDRRITGATDPSQITLTLRQIVVPVMQTFTEAQIRQAGEMAYRVSETMESCEQMRETALASPFMVGGDIGTRRMTALAEPFMQALRGVPEGSTTAPIPSNVGYHILFVCNRQGDEVNLPTRESIETQLFDQQLSSISRRHLRDLHRDALIDIREGFGG